MDYSLQFGYTLTGDWISYFIVLCVLNRINC